MYGNHYNTSDSIYYGQTFLIIN